MIQLNKNQHIAATQTEDALVVVAGPGTGKTQVLSQRVKNLLLNGVDAKNILLLTYTEAGVTAMRKRLIEIIGLESYRVHIHTFHSLCNDIIKTNEYYFSKRDYEPISKIEKIRVVRSIIQSLEDDSPLKRFSGDVFYDTNKIITHFDYMKSEKKTEESIIDQCKAYSESLPSLPEFQYKRVNSKRNILAGDPKIKDIQIEREKLEKTIAVTKLYSKYCEILDEIKRYDFADMINWVSDAFAESPNLLLNYQEKFQYFLVDEFQDTNGSQDSLLSNLTNYWDSPNLFVVGDEDQSIYEFNGARIENLISYIKKYPSVVLYENYRSNTMILGAAGKLISHNDYRICKFIDIDKTVVSSGHNDGKGPVVVKCQSPLEESTYIFTKIKELIDAGESPSNIAVIYRKHSLATDLLNLLKDYPVNTVKPKDVLTDKRVIQLISFAKYCSNPYANIDMLLEIMHYDWIGCDRSLLYNAFADRLKDQALKDELNSIISPWIKEMNSVNLYGFFLKVISEMNIIDSVEEIKTFLNFVKNIQTIGDLIDEIDAMKANKIQLSIENYMFSNNNDAINLTTAHGAKGLEFKHVFIMSANADQWEKSRNMGSGFLIPNYNNIASSKEEVERRLFYVAMTRAEQYLYISYYDKNEAGSSKQPSQFIYEALDVEHETPNITPLIEESFTEKVDLKGILDKDKYLHILDNFRVSPTSLNTFRNCEIEFFFKHILKVPQKNTIASVTGIAIHAGMQAFNTIKNKSGVDFVYIAKQEAVKVLSRYVNEFPSWKINNALNVIDFTLRSIEFNDSTTLAEYSFTPVLDDVPLKVILDKIAFDGNMCTITDYKTGKLDSIRERMNDMESIDVQLTFYKIAFDLIKYKNWKFKAANIEVLNVDKHSILDHPITNESLVISEIKRMWTAVQNFDFKKCDNPDCKYCKLI